MGSGIDPVAVSLLDPSSATMPGGRDVTKRQKERGEQTSRLGSVACTSDDTMGGS